MKKETLWYIILLPILFIILVIISVIDFGIAQFKQFEQTDEGSTEVVETETIR